MANQASGINVCPRFDTSQWTPASVLTLDVCHWIRCATPIGKFRIETVIGDAFRYGFNLKKNSKKPPRWALPLFVETVKYSDTFGYSGVHDPDGVTMQSLPPLFSSSRGGIGAFDEDDKGNPISWHYYTSSAPQETIPLDMKKLILFSGMKCDLDYRGHSVFEPVAHDIIYLQRWRLASGERAKEYANAGKIAVKEGAWDSIEKSEIAKIFPNAKIFTVGIKQGTKFELLDIGGLLNETEQAMVIESFKEMIAGGFGVTKSDITGANAGEKLGADFNQSSYFMTLEDIQRHYSEQAYQFFEHLSVAFPGLELDEDFPFKAPREVPVAERVQTLTDIAMSYLMLGNQGKDKTDPRTGETTPGDPALASAGQSMAAIMKELFFTQASLI